MAKVSFASNVLVLAKQNLEKKHSVTGNGTHGGRVKRLHTLSGLFSYLARALVVNFFIVVH
jgi:hypothetical protein